MTVFTQEASARRRQFLKYLFGDIDGLFCIARRVRQGGVFEEKFFEKTQLDEAEEFINSCVMTHDLWYCPMTFSAPQRRKETVHECKLVWADLDTCPADRLLVTPTVLVESSPDRLQALWQVAEEMEPLDAENMSKRIAYFHSEAGADKSGWDITQLLRLPMTHNYKYLPPAEVKVLSSGEAVSIVDLQTLYPMLQEDVSSQWPFPDTWEEGATILDRYRHDLDANVWKLIQLPPEEDWSGQLWRLELLLSESALTREEIFSIVREAACNKFRRDGRSDKVLWRDVCKAWARVKERSILIEDATVFKNPDLLSDEDIRAADHEHTFLEEYIEWAAGVGDAAEAYHQAGAFTALSGLIAGRVVLPTSYGTLIPNLWFLLLADTTLTRKSTALDLAIDLLAEIDSDVVMATDGSIEGLFTALSARAGRASIFLRDEFSGLLELMNRRDYYAGMAETLTKMYDGKFQKRVLRRETIEVKDPVLIILAGGIRSKVLQLLQFEHVSSGFMPRFVFITAKSNLAKMKPLGPPNESSIQGRDKILQSLIKIRSRYHRQIEVNISSVKMSTQEVTHAELTPDAWERYNVMELRLLESGVKSIAQDMLTPTMDRLSKSGLKAAVLIAAARCDDRVLVEERDIVKAFSYVMHWREYAMEVISGIGTSQQESLIGLVFEAINRNPGVLRSTLMQNYHLTKRDADGIFDTLDQRGLINRIRSGRSEKLTSTTL